MKEDQKIVIYQTEDGQTQIDVRLENETVWLTQAQMAELFEKTPQNITMHIGNAYKEGELKKEATCKEYLQVQTEGKRKVSRKVKYYDLDVIISVGYRVHSKRGTAFRIWARKIIKDYLVKGYAINDRIRKDQIAELRQLVQVAGRAISNQKVPETVESQDLLNVVVDYTYALDTLDNYDYERLTIDKTTKEERFHATYDNAMEEINRLRDKFGGSTLFGNQWLLTANLDVIDPAMGHCKGMEIASWLTDNAGPDARYVIIDDEYVILDSQLPNFILTNPYDGITEELADKAISILNK